MVKKACISWVLTIVGIALVWSMGTTVALSADRITSDIKVTTEGKLSDKEKRALSHAAVKILKHVHQARVDIRYKDDKDALRHTEKAMKLVKIIENALPRYNVSTTIKSGDMTYQDEEKVKQTLITIYTELDEVTSLVLPVKRAKLEAAESQVGGSTSLQYTNIMLDLGETKFDLEQAAEHLKKNDPKAANTSLRAVQEGVIFEYDEVDVPLLKARWNLIDASRHYARKEYKAAQRSLERAASALEIYKKRVGSQVSKRAQELADEIKSLAGKLEKETEGAADQITGFWDSLTNFF
jgi:hypothetical protein